MTFWWLGGYVGRDNSVVSLKLAPRGRRGRNAFRNVLTFVLFDFDFRTASVSCI